MTAPDWHIYRATPDQRDDLFELMLSSQAVWGESAAFLAACRRTWYFPVRLVAEQPVYALDVDGRLTGMVHLMPRIDGLILNALFVAPDALRQGWGRRLFKHAVEAARALGSTAFTLDADPHAVGFYEHMGAVAVGQFESLIERGRMMTVMRVELDTAEAGASRG